MKLVAEFIGNRPVQFGSANFARLPDGIENRVDVLSGVTELWRWDVSEWFRAFFGFVVASDVISTSVALPERQRSEIGSAWVDFLAGGEPCRHFAVASAAKNTHNEPSEIFREANWPFDRL